MHETERVLVVGGTRGTGLLIAHLLQRRGYSVRALSRNPTRAAAALGSAVEIVPGDVTKPETLSSAVRGLTHLIFTAGVAVGPAREKLIVATEYQGVVNMLAAARQAGFNGRFLYMTSIGVTKPSLTAAFLNLVKGNTLRWRRRAEEDIRTTRDACFYGSEARTLANLPKHAAIRGDLGARVTTGGKRCCIASV